MKKQTKKKLENDLATAIQSILAKYDSNAIEKTIKTIKQSVKLVIKKFNKTSKVLTKKKQVAKVKRKMSKKTTIKKPAVAKPASAGYTRPKRKPVRIAPSAVSAQPLTTSIGLSPENQ